MTKPVILLASTLKSARDARMYYKIGKTLAGTGKYEIHTIGNSDSREIDSNEVDQPIATHIFRIRGRSFTRFFAGFNLIIKLFQIRPRVLFICTHELLFAALVLKPIFRYRLIYDIQENYYLNLICISDYFKPITVLLALWIRAKENCISPFIDLFLLAENCYKTELNFVKNEKLLILENKSIWHPEAQISSSSPSKPYLKAIFSGTLSESSGIMQAISVGRMLMDQFAGSLTIIGQCLSPKLLAQLENIATEDSRISMMISQQNIPYSEIEKELRKSNMVLATYNVTRSNRSKIPTKFYESTGLGIPVVYSKNDAWDIFFSKNKNGIPYSPGDAPESIIKQLHALIPPTNPPDQSAYWAENKQYLIDAINELI